MSFGLFGKTEKRLEELEKRVEELEKGIVACFGLMKTQSEMMNSLAVECLRISKFIENLVEDSSDKNPRKKEYIH